MKLTVGKVHTITKILAGLVLAAVLCRSTAAYAVSAQDAQSLQTRSAAAQSRSAAASPPRSVAASPPRSAAASQTRSAAAFQSRSAAASQSRSAAAFQTRSAAASQTRSAAASQDCAAEKSGASDEAAGHRVVRVAYPIQRGLTDVDEEGNLSGYTYEYLMEIARYTGWEYEFVMAEDGSDESLTALMEQVDSGEIDLLGGTLYMDQLSGTYLYSSQSYGVVETVLQTTLENSGRVMVNSQADQTMRIAVLKEKGRTIEEFRDYCKMNLIEPELVLCGGEEEQVDAVRDGRADALLNTSLNKLDGVITIARFAPKPFYFVTSKGGDADMMNELSQALYNISLTNPYFSQKLQEKYFDPQEAELSFTEDELAFLAQAAPVRVGILSEQPPFQYDKEHVLGGITIDLLNELSLKSGLHFELVPAVSREELVSLAAAGKIDLVAGINEGWDSESTGALVLSQPYLSAYYMLITYEGAMSDRENAPILAVSHTDIRRLKGYTVQEFASQAACVRAVEEGAADYTYVDACTAQYFLNQPAYSGLKAVPASIEPMRLCFGIINPGDQTMPAILNKTILSLTQEEIQAITTLNTMPERTFSIAAFVQARPVLSIGIVTAVLLLLFALVLLLFLQRMRSARQSALELKKRLRVYSLTNDYFFEYDHAGQILTVSLPGREIAEGARLDHYKRREGIMEDVSGEGDSFWSIVDNCRSGEKEFYQYCTDGQHHWLRMALETIYDKEEKPSCTIGKISVIDAEREEKAELRSKAQLDSLTEIYNARAFRENVLESLAKLKVGKTGAFLLVDIDYFKNVNDTYGHLQGDSSLCLLSEILRTAIRQEDFAGRFGGDEFLVYLNRMDSMASLAKRCERICQMVRYETAKSECPLTISMGAVLSQPGDDYDTIFKLADTALYATKQHGRNGYSISDREGSIAASSPQTEDSPEEDLLEFSWLRNKKLEAVLRTMKAVVFEFHARTGMQYVSPFISEYLKGNYDGRPLSVVMLEDGVIYPEDVEYSVGFRESCRRGEYGEMTLRLLTQDDCYRWYRMTITPCPSAGEDVFVGVLMDVDMENRQRLQLCNQIRFDRVCRIYNRGSFFEEMEKILKAAPDKEHYLVRFDIDRFKLINELYSTDEGDRVLCHIGELLKENARAGEAYGRLRDDVFAMCVARTGRETTRLIRMLQDKLNETTLAFQFVISAGIVHIPKYGGEPMNLLGDWAVMAQRTIKGNYIKPYAFYEKSMSDALNREHFLIASMEDALKNQEFIVYLQPQYNIMTGELVGAEALARWKHPETGMISPGEFIPLFERNGFILSLDEYIWEQTCRLLRGWIDEGYRPPSISVNVSRIHLYDPDFCSKIKALCRNYGLAPDMLDLEITESAYTECPEKLYGIMDELQEEGFSFSMDDFGSGYSSLNSLKDIPVDIVKIDLNFLKDARQGKEKGHIILEGTVKMLQDMGLPIIAEGVETAEQAELLKNIGCSIVQGFHYGRPMPASEFRSLLDK